MKKIRHSLKQHTFVVISYWVDLHQVCPCLFDGDWRYKKITQSHLVIAALAETAEKAVSYNRLIHRERILPMFCCGMTEVNSLP